MRLRPRLMPTSAHVDVAERDDWAEVSLDRVVWLLVPRTAASQPAAQRWPLAYPSCFRPRLWINESSVGTGNTTTNRMNDKRGAPGLEDLNAIGPLPVCHRPNYLTYKPLYLPQRTCCRKSWSFILAVASSSRQSAARGAIGTIYTFWRGRSSTIYGHSTNHDGHMTHLDRGFNLIGAAR